MPDRDATASEVEAVAEALYGNADALAMTHARRAIAALDEVRAAGWADEFRNMATILHNIHRGGGIAGVAMAECGRDDCRKRAALLAELSGAPEGRNDGE